MTVPETLSLPHVPTGWVVGRIGNVAMAWTSNVDKHSVDGEPTVRLCNYTDVYKNELITEGLNFMEATARADQIERFQLRRGDTVITKDSETADDIGVPAFVVYEADDLVCGYHLAIVRPDPSRITPKFLYWVMTSQTMSRQWAVLATGVTRVGIRSNDLSKASIPIPPFEVQRAISDYLDRETTKIDTLIEEQNRLIELTWERRNALVESAVANVEARGTRLKHYVTSVVQGWSPQCNNWSADGVKTWAVLKAGAANGGQFHPDENKELPEQETPRPETVVRPGHLVVSRANTRELLGSAAVVEETYPRLMLSDKLYALTLNESRALPQYVALLLGVRRWRDLIELEATGSSPSMQNISQSDILNLPMELPPIEVQVEVVRNLQLQTTKIDTLIAETERFIELAKERRSALITAAVTGQIDVRDQVDQGAA